jgi:hypothetical protein
VSALVGNKLSITVPVYLMNVSTLTGKLILHAFI